MNGDSRSAAILPAVVALLVAFSTMARAETTPYTFDGAMPRAVLEAYLARSTTVSDMLLDWMDPYRAENLRMLTNMGAKFLGRAVLVWGNESEFPNLVPRLANKIADVHAADPEMIVQGGIFEYVSRDVENVPIPAWVFEAFELTPEARSFDYDGMTWSCGEPYLYEDGGTVPDVARTETQLWIFYQAASLIDAGVEALHLGQFEWMSGCTENFAETEALTERIRAYAALHARRHWVLLDAHTHGIVREGRLLLDFHSFPLRIKEGLAPDEGILELGFLDSIYGDSAGGLTPSGWTCDHAPYLVEFDHGYAGDVVGACDKPECVWGCDEVTWFAYLTEEARNHWLRYAWHWLRDHDADGWLEVAGTRDIQGVAPNGSDYYFANTYDPAIMARGFNQEETIRALWLTGGGGELPCAGEPDACRCYADLFTDEWNTLAGLLGCNDDGPNVAGVLVPERWTLALVRAYLCRDDLPLHSRVVQTYLHNRTSLACESAAVRAGIESFENILAALVLASAALRDHFVDEFELSGDYDVFEDSAKGVEEPFSEMGDIDGDGLNNLQEYDNVVASGGSAEDFAEAASNPESSGNTMPLHSLSVLPAIVGVALSRTRRLRPRKGPSRGRTT